MNDRQALLNLTKEQVGSVRDLVDLHIGPVGTDTIASEVSVRVAALAEIVGSRSVFKDQLLIVLADYASHAWSHGTLKAAADQVRLTNQILDKLYEVPKVGPLIVYEFCGTYILAHEQDLAIKILISLYSDHDTGNIGESLTKIADDLTPSDGFWENVPGVEALRAVSPDERIDVVISGLVVEVVICEPLHAFRAIVPTVESEWLQRFAGGYVTLSATAAEWAVVEGLLPGVLVRAEV